MDIELKFENEKNIFSKEIIKEKNILNKEREKLGKKIKFE